MRADPGESIKKRRIAPILLMSEALIIQRERRLVNAIRLEIPGKLYQEIVQKALAERPNECCGLLAGKLLQPGPTGILVGGLERHFAMTNAKAGPRRYAIDPAEMAAAMREMRRDGTRELAFYHSHPTSEPVPSKRDWRRTATATA